jgi:four helix bundle protein
MGYEPERLLVYRLALRLNALVAPIARRAGVSGRPDLANQLLRAAASVSLNIAEGAAELRPAEKARLYRIARRSAEETRTALRLIEADSLAPTADLSAARRLAARLTYLLLRLITAMNNRA